MLAGSGKTTLLDTLAGCRAPDAGDVRINGLAMAPRQLRDVVGYVMQAKSLSL